MRRVFGASASRGRSRWDNLCDVPGVLVGHATDPDGITGCTAVLFGAPAVAGVDVRGPAPGTQQTDALTPTGRVGEVHAVLLTGGSAFGLAATVGVMAFLKEEGVGYDVGVARVPIVPAAVLFDLGVGDPGAHPGPAMGREAASSAASGDFAQGSVGAGTGATVGKSLGTGRAMKGGVGSASKAFSDGLVVGALAVANALGDVRDPKTGAIVAGPRLRDGSLGDSLELAREAAATVRWGENTCLGVVATNARLTKPEATRVARMAHDGLARAVHPAHTSVDGDAIFAASVGGGVDAPADVVGAWGAWAMAESVVRAVRAADGLPGIPAAPSVHGGERGP